MSAAHEETVDARLSEWMQDTSVEVINDIINRTKKEFSEDSFDTQLNTMTNLLSFIFARHVNSWFIEETDENFNNILNAVTTHLRTMCLDLREQGKK